MNPADDIVKSKTTDTDIGRYKALVVAGKRITRHANSPQGQLTASADAGLLDAE